MRNALGLLPLLLPVLAQASRAGVQQPNIVFVYCDDARWDTLGVVQREQGERARWPWLRTPNIDRLSEQGVRFRQSFVVASLCSPARAAVMTAQYGHRNGVLGNRSPLPTDVATVAKQLQAAGYRTGYFGKWHMRLQRKRPGFDRFASYVGHGEYQDCDFLVDGVLQSSEGWVDDVATDHAIEFLGAQSEEQPFLLWLGFKSPHGPRGGDNLPERLRATYAGERSGGVPNLTTPAAFQEEPATSDTSGADTVIEAHLDFMRHITGIDTCLGRLLDVLDASPHAENTVVMFSSDNGYYLGEHGGLNDKRTAYEESMRVPLIVRMPGDDARRGVTEDALVLNIDYAPTLLELAGAGPLPDVHGRSLLPLLRAGSPPSDWRSEFFYEYFFEEPYPSPTTLALRTQTHKLIVYPGHDEWTEVFDLEADPYETKNLAADPKLLARLRSLFQETAKRTGFDPTGPMPVVAGDSGVPSDR
jgi:arylsulfatase A-like enzyme